MDDYYKIPNVNKDSVFQVKMKSSFPHRAWLRISSLTIKLLTRCVMVFNNSKITHKELLQTQTSLFYVNGAPQRVASQKPRSNSIGFNYIGIISYPSCIVARNVTVKIINTHPLTLGIRDGNALLRIA